MTTYPGVYIQELPSQVHTIAGVATSITAFVGYTARGIDNRAEAITSFADFERLFGGLASDSELSYAVQQFFANGGTQGVVVRVPRHGAAGASVQVGNAAAGSPKPNLTFTALSSGTWADGVLLIDIDYDGVDQNANPTAFNLTITNPMNGTVESFPAVSLNGSNANYVQAVVNDPDTGSQLVKVSDASWSTWPSGTQSAVPSAAPAVTGLVGSAPSTSQLGGTTANADYGVNVAVSAPTNTLPAVDVKLFANGAPVPQSVSGLAAQMQAALNAALAVQWPGASVICRPTGAGAMQAIRVLASVPNFPDAMLKLGYPTPASQLQDAAGALGGEVVLQVAVTGSPTGGTFTLSTGGQTTGNIVFNAKAADVQSALQGLSKVGANNALVTGPDGGPWPVRFAPGLGDVTLTGNGGGLTGGTSPDVKITPKSQPASANVAHYALGTGNALGSQTASTAGTDGSGLPQTGDLKGDPGAFTGLYALDKVDLFNLLVIPDATRAAAGNPLALDPSVNPAAIYSAAVVYCKSRRAFVLVDSPPNVKDVASAVDWKASKIGVHDENGAAFFPRLRLPDPLNNYQLRTFAPSGVVAGLYARIDGTRGVWKAPAGTEATLTGVQGLVYKLTDTENGMLNPIAVNCSRIFPIYGPVLWGARTLVGADAEGSQWKYVPVRRLALYLEESLYRGTQWAVFEPNDEPLWAQLRLNVGAFMHDLFRKGAFQGQSPKDAYFVKCDKDTTTQNDIDNGVVNVLVGFAPLKPAEFVVIQIQQMAGQVQT
jgi:phage tail sheath protein FI